jgi:hypothetical protein
VQYNSCNVLARTLNHQHKIYFMAKSSKSGTKRGSGKRELIDTGNDKRFVKRNTNGTFKESDDVGKSLSQDVKKHAKKKVKPGYGDKGDQPKKKSGAKR